MRGSKWQWRSGPFEWSDFDDTTAAFLGVAFDKFVDSNQTAPPVTHGEYEFHFLTMDQVNKDSRFRRDLRCLMETTPSPKKEKLENDGGVQEEAKPHRPIRMHVPPPKLVDMGTPSHNSLQFEGFWWRQHKELPMREYVPLASLEGRLLNNFFHSRGGSKIGKVLAIERVRNPATCRAHRVCAKEMLWRPHPEGSDPCNSALLFHGCSQQVFFLFFFNVFTCVVTGQGCNTSPRV